MTPLEATNARHGFSSLPLYKQLYAEGLLGTGQMGPDWRPTGACSWARN